MTFNDYPLWLGYTNMPDFLETSVTMAKASGTKLIDTNGKEYIDLESGIRNVILGYTNNEITNAITTQLKILPYSRSAHFGNKPALELAQVLANFSPVKNPRILFHSSGSESIEASIKIVRQLAFINGNNKKNVLVINKGYHGQTLAALTASGDAFSKAPFEPFMPGFDFIEIPQSMQDIQNIHNLIKDSNIGAILLEPILGNGGIISIAESLLIELRKICDDLNILLICDETTTGLGRCGRWFLSDSCSPDILIIGKALTNGFLPLSALIVAENIWGQFDMNDYFRHGQTYLNHPVCCAAGIATIAVLKKIDAPTMSQKKEIIIKEMFKELILSERIIELRGKGLLWAIEINAQFSHAKKTKKWFQTLMLEKGIIIGQIESTIFLSPALIIEDKHIYRLVEHLDKILK